MDYYKGYKRFIKNKKTYLLRKKHINRHLQYLKKEYKNSKGCRKWVYGKRIEIWEEQLDILNVMYFYTKFKKRRQILFNRR